MTRKVLDFATSPSGKFIGFGVVLAFLCLAFSYYRSLPTKKEKKEEASFHDTVKIKRSFSNFRDGFSSETEEDTPVQDKNTTGKGNTPKVTRIKSEKTKAAEKEVEKAKAAL